MLPTGTGQPVAGSAAITPHLHAVPAYTTDDMVTYVKSHPLPGNLASGSAPTILQAAFLPGATVTQLLGTPIGRSDATLVGYVELQGSFAFVGAVPATSPVYPYAFALFDAQSGNLLMFGGLERPIPTATPTATPTPINPSPTPTATQAPPHLSVSPAGTTDVTCATLPISYPTVTVKNTGGGTLQWQVTATNANVTVSPASGSLGAGQPQTLAVSQTSGSGGTDLHFTSNGGSATISFECIVT